MPEFSRKALSQLSADYSRGLKLSLSSNLQKTNLLNIFESRVRIISKDDDFKVLSLRLVIWAVMRLDTVQLVPVRDNYT